jgi:hypothetical protein
MLNSIIKGGYIYKKEDMDVKDEFDNTALYYGAMNGNA